MLRKYVRQLNPIQEKYVLPIDKIQSCLFELTVTPHYQQKGVYNPYYTLDINVEKDIRPTVGKGEIKFQNVLKGQGKLLKAYGKGKFVFQIVVGDTPTEYFITTPKKPYITGHLGMARPCDRFHLYLALGFSIMRHRVIFYVAWGDVEPPARHSYLRPLGSYGFWRT